MAMVIQEEPILSRLERLDIMMGYLEEIRGCNKSASGRSSCDTRSSGGTAASDGGNLSVGSSPRRLEKRCRPVDVVIVETQLKGNLLDRLMQLENRILKMSLLLEEEMEGDHRKHNIHKEREEKGEKKSPHKKGFKGLVKSCVKGTKHKAKG